VLELGSFNRQTLFLLELNYLFSGIGHALSLSSFCCFVHFAFSILLEFECGGIGLSLSLSSFVCLQLEVSFVL